MGRVEFEGLENVGFPLVDCLTGKTEHEIDAYVAESFVATDGYGFAGLG